MSVTINTLLIIGFILFYKYEMLKMTSKVYKYLAVTCLCSLLYTGSMWSSVFLTKPMTDVGWRLFIIFTAPGLVVLVPASLAGLGFLIYLVLVLEGGKCDGCTQRRLGYTEV